RSRACAATARRQVKGKGLRLKGAESRSRACAATARRWGKGAGTLGTGTDLLLNFSKGGHFL
ncbi:MAG: hypothetical protein RR731_05775, partial [Oscillospiraceae bacterium]